MAADDKGIEMVCLFWGREVGEHGDGLGTDVLDADQDSGGAMHGESFLRSHAGVDDKD